MLLSPGQSSDLAAVAYLLDGLPAPLTVVADRGYDRNAVLELIARSGAQPNIPSCARRVVKRSVEPAIYRQRNLIERCFCKLKHFRRVATRFDKLSRNYPVTDLSRIGESESYRLFGDGRAGLSTADMIWSSSLYAPDPTSRHDWRCSPMLMPAGLRLPPTLILTAEFDVLRSDGEAFAGLLRGRGVTVAHHRISGVNHGFLAATAVPQVDDAYATITAWIASRTSR